MKLTKEFIYAIAPTASLAIVDSIVADQSHLTEWGITSPADVCYFLGQCAAETQGFTRLEESLFYTTTRRLREVWPSRFKTDAAAAPYVRNPQKLANLVYGGRLGNIGPDDGWRYRGSGMKQTTGLFNFNAVEKATGIRCVSNPELLRRFPEALVSACVYWSQNKLARFVAAGDVKGLTKAVQGGTGALAERQTYTDRALAALKAKSLPAAPAAAGKALRNGAKGQAVVQLQTALNGLGYQVGLIDGKFGDGTEDAVKLFQKAHGLIVDGVVGDATWNMLQFGNAEPRQLPVLREPSGLDRFIAWILTTFTKR